MVVAEAERDATALWHQAEGLFEPANSAVRGGQTNTSSGVCSQPS